MRFSAAIALGSALLLSGGGGFALLRQHATQQKLQLQLQQLDEVLRADNADAAQAATRAFLGLKVEVIKNQSQPADLALLARARAFADQADTVALLLSTWQTTLRRATGNPIIPSPAALLEPNAAGTVAALLGPGTAAHNRLTRQLATYTRLRRQLFPADTVVDAELHLAGLPTGAALAHLAYLESHLRATEIATLHHLAPALGARRLTRQGMAVVTAAVNAVEAGSVYRAELSLAQALRGPRIFMTCDGKPVPIGVDGVGLVRFQAPTRLGRAAWLGTVHVQRDGRDTTFQVRVPYRVARP